MKQDLMKLNSMNSIKVIGLQEIIKEQIKVNGKADELLVNLLNEMNSKLTEEEQEEVRWFNI